MPITKAKKPMRRIPPDRAVLNISLGLHAELTTFCESRKPLPWGLAATAELAIRQYMKQIREAEEFSAPAGGAV